MDGRSLGCHVEAFPDFGSSPFNLAFAFEPAGVPVVGSYTSEGDNLIALELSQFTEVGQQGPGRDRADSGNRLKQAGFFAELVILFNEVSDSIINNFYAFFYAFDHPLNIAFDILRTVLDAVLLSCQLLGEVTSSIQPSGQFLAPGIGDSAWLQAFLLGKTQNHQGIYGISLGFETFATRVVADEPGIDLNHCYLLLMKVILS